MTFFIFLIFHLMICYAVNLLFIYCMMRSKCSHPKLLVDSYNTKKACNEAVSEELEALVRIITSHTAGAGAVAGASTSTTLQGGGSGAGGGGGAGSSGAASRTGGVASLLTRHSLNNPLAALANKSFSLKGGGKSGGGGGGERIDPDLSGMLH
jgi:hypothetical protein